MKITSTPLAAMTIVVAGLAFDAGSSVAGAQVSTGEPYEPFVVCSARVKDVIYVSRVSRWSGPIKYGPSTVDRNPYYGRWIEALAVVGGDWRSVDECMTGNTAEEVEQKILASSERHWVDNPPIERLDWHPDGDAPAKQSSSKKEALSHQGGSQSSSEPDVASTSADPSAAEELQRKQREAHETVEARNRAAQEKYEAELAEQKRQVEEFERAKEEVARKKAEQEAAAQAALAAHDDQLAAAAEAQRKHEADVAKYEQEVAAQKLRRDFDVRHKLGQASSDTDANQCVTTPETKLNDTTQGNTAAYVVNGCGQPIDIQICLMTTGGWNCGVTYGLGSQQSWSHSSFNATGQVYSNARTSGSNRPLAKPN